MMSTHGAAEDAFQEASSAELKPTMLQDDGLAIFILETEKPLFLSEWAFESALKNPGPRPKPKL